MFGLTISDIPAHPKELDCYIFLYEDILFYMSSMITNEYRLALRHWVTIKVYQAFLFSHCKGMFATFLPMNHGGYLGSFQANNYYEPLA